MAEEKTDREIRNDVALAISDKQISDKILASFNTLVNQGQLKFPNGYNVGNQLKLAYLQIIQDANSRTATPVSIAQCLTEMCLQGLDVSKKQCYFIKYGNNLQMFRSYFGDISVAYSTGLVKEIKALVVHQGDEFEIDVEDGQEVVKEHKTSFANKDNEIIGAYAIATMPDESKRYCIMTRKQINVSWSKAKTRNVINEFGEEMAKRTVIRRLVKMLFNTASSNDSFTENVISSYNRTTEEEYNNDHVERIEEQKSTIDIPSSDVFDLEETETIEEDLPFESEDSFGLDSKIE